jgi:hypothetical protein
VGRFFNCKTVYTKTWAEGISRFFVSGAGSGVRPERKKPVNYQGNC